MLFGHLAYAQSAAPQGPTIFDSLMPFVFIIIIFYFLMIRPQQRRAKQHVEFLKQLKRGDSILTASGILGTIEGLTDKFVTLEVADDVRIRILKSQIASSAVEEEKKK